MNVRIRTLPRLAALMLCLLLAACGARAQRASPAQTPAFAATAQPAAAATATVRESPAATGEKSAVTNSPLPSPTPEPAPTATPVPTPADSAAAPIAEARAGALLARMTLEEKVGQLFLVFFEGPDLSPALARMIAEKHVGGIVLFAISGNIENPAQLARLTRDAQQVAARAGAGIPLFVAIDQEGGPVSRLTDGFTVFPSNMAVGATRSPEWAREMASVMAAEMLAVGINMNLAPVMDVNDNPDNPVIGLRSFGSSPGLVAQLGTAMIAAYQENGILATAKHFPGHGNTSVDSHVGLPVVAGSRERLDAVELAPFRAAVAAGVGAIMTAHVVVPSVEPAAGLPATLSARVLTGLLREELGYEGLIVTDSLGMGALARYGAVEVAARAFEAGADVLAFGADQGHSPEESAAAYDYLLEQARQGVVSPERIDDSVRRILLAKARLGLLDERPAAPPDVNALAGTAEHRAVALDLARASITLVRDECGVLPVGPEEQAAVIWPRVSANLGAVLQAQHGGLQELPVGIDPSADEIATAVALARSSRVVVVGTANARRHPAQAQLVEALQASADRCKLVVVALESPYDLLAFPEVPAYLATYGVVPVSLEALAEALTGALSPRGHLPVDLQ